MGLTQVMLQVKDCEMVCKQRELIPRLKGLSPARTELNRYPPRSLFASLLLLLLLLLFLPRFPFLPTLSSLSNSLWQRSAGAVGAIKKVPKHSVKSRLLTKMRLDEDQYSLPLLPNTRAHPSTNRRHRRASESVALQVPTLWLASSLSYGAWAYLTRALLLKAWDGTQIRFTNFLWVRFIVGAVLLRWSIIVFFWNCLKWIDRLSVYRTVEVNCKNS